MDVRAKLLELILEHNSHHVVICDSCLCDTPEEHYSKIHGLIDFLVSNGITIDPASLRPKGEWITFGKRGIYGNMYACSECQAKYDGQSNFCPNCGADMRGNPNDS